MDILLQTLLAPVPMKHYTAMMLACDGKVVLKGRLLAADDADALSQAEDLAKELAIDVWDGLRFVGLVEAARLELV